ncbi:MAG: hypothetical protein OXG71_00080 [Rhodospirillales bacterium]|nr:hypothetical protein [Rhodospirillales bacterium]MXX22198.1 hypothetical protein [Rhodospirillales bacterium]MYE18411.1 hypothetical protein [Rhodospirillales bacterium]
MDKVSVPPRSEVSSVTARARASGTVTAPASPPSFQTREPDLQKKTLGVGRGDAYAETTEFGVADGIGSAAGGRSPWIWPWRMRVRDMGNFLALHLHLGTRNRSLLHPDIENARTTN